LSESASGFSLTCWNLSFPWLGEADLVIIETRDVGWIATTATVDRFVVQPSTSVVESRP
jgi:hypothetical protein